MKKIESVFAEYDIEDSGYLNSDDLCKALQDLKIPVQAEDIQDILESVGKQKEGKIDLDDFLDIVSELKNIEDSEDDDIYIPNTDKNLYTTFQILKSPSESGINLENMLRVCALENPSWTKDQVVEMFNKADTNHDGVIDFNELKIIYKKAGLC